MTTMARSPWVEVGSVLVAVAMLVGAPALALHLGWPLAENSTWTWVWQHLRGGTVPAEVVVTASVAALWAVWAAYLLLVLADTVNVVRGLVPRVGLVRLVWVFTTGGATAVSAHTAAYAAQSVPVTIAEHPATVADQPQDPRESPEDGVVREQVDRTRTLSYFAFDSAELSPAMRESLAPTADLIADFAASEASVLITGYSDPVGDPDHNLALSEERAQVVANYLAERADVTEFEVRGAGIMPQRDPDVSHGELRRVEITYTLELHLSSPEPIGSAGAEEQAEADPGIQPSHMRSDNRDGPSVDLLTLASGAATGAVGLVGGYVLGQRRPTTRRRPRTRATAEDEAASLEEHPQTGETGAPAPSAEAEDVIRQDEQGIRRGPIDEDGYLLVCETLRVSGSEGVAFFGRYAAPALATIVADYAPGQVIATHQAHADLNDVPSASPGVQIVPDVASAHIAAEAGFLARARDEELDDKVEHGPPMLLIFTASDIDDTGADHSSSRFSTPAQTIVCVLGRTQAVPVMVDCGAADHVRVLGPQGEHVQEAPLRLAVPKSPGPEQGNTPVATASPVPNHGENDDREREEGTPEAGAAEFSDSPTARVRLFGPKAECEVNGQNVLHGVRTSASTLLAALALAPTRGLSSERVTHILAPDMTEKKAIKYRANAVGSLRQAVRAALDLDASQPVVENSQGRYRLQEEIFDIDVREFRALHQRAKSGKDEEEEESLRKMVDLYRFDLLSEVDGDWLLVERRDFQVIFADTCVRVAKIVEEGHAKIHFIECALRVDALNEHLHREKMQVFASMGRKDKVHQAFAELREHLTSAGMRPGKESHELLRELAG